jgi:hypothetical protein
VKADELWEKYSYSLPGEAVNRMSPEGFLAALAEYEEIVKAEAVKVCSEKVRGMCGNNCAAAIEKMKLP